jgi:hypothetical protein
MTLHLHHRHTRNMFRGLYRTLRDHLVLLQKSASSIFELSVSITHQNHQVRLDLLRRFFLLQHWSITFTPCCKNTSLSFTLTAASSFSTRRSTRFDCEQQACVMTADCNVSRIASITALNVSYLVANVR